MPITLEQKQIIESEEKKIAVVAAAGVGKTFTLVHRLKHLVNVKQVKPERVLLMSFSRVAASELREKIEKELGADICKRVQVGTIHSLCYKICLENLDKLKLKKIDIVNESYLAGIVFNTAPGLFSSKSDASSHTYNWHKHQMAGKPYIACTKQQLEVIENSKKQMRDNGKLIYDDLMLEVIKLFENNQTIRELWQNKFDHIVGDESQDTSLIQHKVFDLMITETTNVIIVGDVKQTLYAFRGAHYQNIDDFIKKYNAKVYYLNETFRFGQKFADIGNSVIDQMQIDPIYKVKTVTNVQRNPSPQPIVMPIAKQIDDILYEIRKYKTTFKYSDMNVIYRYNKEAIPVIQKFIAEGIPFEVKSGDIFERSELKFLIRAISLIHTFTIGDTIDLFKYYVNFIGDKTLTSLYHEVGDKENVVKFVEACLKVNASGIGPKKREMLEQMAFRLSNTAKYMASESGKVNFTRIAKLLDMDQTKFMVKVENAEGDDIGTERWEYLSFFQQNFNESEYTDPIEWYNHCLLDASKTSGEKKDAVQLKTIHGCKGQSLPIVFYLASGMFHKFFIKTEEDIESEFFVLYVAVTRAEQVLKVYHENPGMSKISFLFPIENGANQPIQVQRQEARESKAHVIARSNLTLNRYKFRSRVNKQASIGAQTEKAVLLKLNEISAWVPITQLGYDGEHYFLQDWFVQKNNLGKLCR